MKKGHDLDRQRGRNSGKWLRRLCKQLFQPRTVWLLIGIGKLIVGIVKTLKD